MHRFQLLRLTILWALLATGVARGQAVVTGTISGTVTDQTGAVVPSAAVKITHEATGTVYNARSNEVGIYVQPGLATGFYRIDVSAPGFRQAVVARVKVDVGGQTVENIKLEVGSTTESVMVQAESTPIVTATSAIGATITGRQIVALPFTSRDALDLALLVAGSSGGGSPRASSFNALPKSAINITMDGLNTMDNLLKSSYGGGFFTYIRPRIDAVEEFSITTAAAGAESAGEGAVQIRFVTRRGTNDWHGGLYWYHRNTALNSNYYFNNLNGLPRQRMLLNQYGGKVGGPIVRNKLFFFTNLEEYRLPESTFRQRDILKSEAINGVFRYRGTDNAERTANVLDIARANSFPSTHDPLVKELLTRIDALRGQGGVGITTLDLFRDRMGFNNSATQLRRFPTARLDWNISDRVQWEAIWNYNYFYSFPDTLNSSDRYYPGFDRWGSLALEGGQISNRFSLSSALRVAVSPTINNELRWGVNGGTVGFSSEIDPLGFPNNLRVSTPLVTSPLSRGLGSRRNTPLQQFSDNLGWVWRSHTMNLGFNLTALSAWSKEYGTMTPTATIGMAASDPASALFSSTTMPAINTTDLANARSLYALLTGRISGVTGNIYVDETQKKFVPLKPLVRREKQRELGLYFTDNWRARPTVTINYGLRWEYQGAPYDTNGIYTSPGYEGLWGVSGVGNLFRPGVFGGRPTVFNPRSGPMFETDWNNFGPSLGLAWQPKSDHWLVRSLFGQGGAVRVGYGISFIREGLQVLRSIAGSNAGTSAQTSLVADTDFPAGSLLLRNPLPELKRFPAEYSFPLPLSLFTYRGTSPRWAEPHVATPYVQSWSLGIQREVLKDTVLEVRYVGNRGVKLWRLSSLNEVNIFENGFLQEFQSAQKNLAVCESNRAACTGSTTGALRFDNRGLAGQARLPIFEAAFAGVAAGSGFANGTFVQNLQQGTAGTLAGSLAASGTYMPNLIRAGFPSNLFQVNPEAANASSWMLHNGSDSSYHSLQVEVRRAFTRGLMFSGNYSFSKGLTDYYADASDTGANYVTWRNMGLNKGLSPYDITHQFKANWIWELPFGEGQRWRTSNPVVERLIGGWQGQGIARLQTGRPFELTGGRNTFNNIDAGVISTLTRQELQSRVGVRKLPDGRVFWLDPALIASDGRADSKYLAPVTTPGMLGQTYLFLHGPGFVRFDLTAAKKTRITERLNLEVRAEFLNAFNTANFLVGGATAAEVASGILGTTFGQTTTAYQDISTTSDPGGRIVQLVLRINF